ncbi:MAG: DNA mismatch endonuclease Vsr [Sterolibacteriaceae bacterium]|uniref:DNA mismatch endonuclease Vsr n=1 Tax=Candidatus Methylophosphatis roskildensis TaxID=2899263 RepID=A0A9D7DZP5_9PROT|nr:DNA mismatch endonuclease Vsr [Candidatus Methylophosphatis roskildensis]
MDIVPPAVRSQMMAGIKGKDTKPEMIVRRTLFAAGFRFRLHRRDLPGMPDVVLPGRKITIFVHGCFWHRHKDCDLAKLPSSNADFWRGKLDANVRRDKQAAEMLRTAGWRVLVIWECSTRGKAIHGLGARLLKWISGDASNGEIAGEAGGSGSTQA